MVFRYKVNQQEWKNEQTNERANITWMNIQHINNTEYYIVTKTVLRRYHCWFNAAHFHSVRGLHCIFVALFRVPCLTFTKWAAHYIWEKYFKHSFHSSVHDYIPFEFHAPNPRQHTNDSIFPLSNATHRNISWIPKPWGIDSPSPARTILY